MRHIGYRSTVVLGVGTATTAFLLTAALLHLELKMLAVFYLVTGGLWGLGMGLTTVPAMTITGQWFSKVEGSYFPKFILNTVVSLKNFIILQFVYLLHYFRKWVLLQA